MSRGFVKTENKNMVIYFLGMRDTPNIPVWGASSHIQDKAKNKKPRAKDKTATRSVNKNITKGLKCSKNQKKK